MASGEFVSADIAKISKFMTDSEEAITEFNSIKEKFNSIDFLGSGAWI